jgi:putative ABC transport system substrate-binding protein
MRRRFLRALAALPAAVVAHSWAQPRMRRIGFLGAESVQQAQGQVAQLRDALKELGYVEGRNIALEVRVANSDYPQLPSLAAELAALKVDVLVASGSKAGYAAKDAARTTPVVVSNMGDALRAGFAASLAQPGGNVTGVSMMNPEVTAKQLELLRRVKPRLARVAILMNPANPNYALTFEALHREASKLKIRVERFDAHDRGEIVAAVNRVGDAKIDAMIVQSETLFSEHGREIAALAVKHRIAAAGIASFVRDGGLIGYSGDRTQLWRQIASYVDRILKGAKAGDLPIEQPRDFLWAVNLSTARALGLTLPEAVVRSMNEVIP